MRLLLAILAICLPGCMSMGRMHRNTESQFLSVPVDLPREQQMTTLPDYQIEAPDILRIELTRLVPQTPYILGPGDGLSVQVTRADGTVMIDSVLHVELDGSLQFGSPFDDTNTSHDPVFRIDGPINVAGVSMVDARRLIFEHVCKTIESPSVRVSLDAFAAQQPISGEHLVAPDGTVNLGAYGRVRVAGLTVEEARDDINSQLSKFLQAPNATVDVYAYNSKRYYIILQGAGLGDRVMQFPVTGNETVLDALSNVEGLSGTSSEEIWVSRPGRNSSAGNQSLPVDWPAMSQAADTTTNYQILPGDRVFVREDKMIAFDTHVGKLIAPIERILGVVLLGTNASSRIQFYQNYGRVGGNTGAIR